MTKTDNGQREPRNIVEEVRAARAAVSDEAGGIEGLGEYLRQIQEEYRTRTGRFADVPVERPEAVQRLIDAAESGNPLLDELRSLRSDAPHN
jgi:hypothetical protein